LKIKKNNCILDHVSLSQNDYLTNYFKILKKIQSSKNEIYQFTLLPEMKEQLLEHYRRKFVKLSERAQRYASLNFSIDSKGQNLGLTKIS